MRTVTALTKTVSAVLFAGVASLALHSGLSAQGQAGGRGQAAPGRGAAPAPPAAQPGHPSGQLVIWGDVVNFNAPGTPNQCVAQSRFRRGERVGFRMTAIDGGTGEVENTAVLVAHLTYAGKTIDVPMRWRGGGAPFPKEAYFRAPDNMWTGGWEVPRDAAVGTVTYTVTATDRFGRKASFAPFVSIPSQIAIIE
jgi:hypothetical protein